MQAGKTRVVTDTYPLCVGRGGIRYISLSEIQHKLYSL